MRCPICDCDSDYDKVGVRCDCCDWSPKKDDADYINCTEGKFAGEL